MSDTRALPTMNKPMRSGTELARTQETLAAPASKTYRAGTLQYTGWGLVNLFVWLLWGDFCFIMLETLFSKFLPIYLKSLQASNGLIGIMASNGSVFGIIGLTVIPPLSVLSDRYRSRWGRRRPFLFLTSPLAALFLILIGFSNDISVWLQGRWLSAVLTVSPATLNLMTFCLFVVFFHLFNCFMSAMLGCLWVDVVPSEVTGRFVAATRLVGTLGGCFFSWFLFGKGETHRREIFLAIGLVYLFSFLLMCWKVKEGEYPPVAEHSGKINFWQSARQYFRESFSIPLYLYFFLLCTFINVSGCIANFFVFFLRGNLSMSLDDIGKFNFWVYLGSAIATLPIGILCDKIKPVRTMLVGVVFLFLCHLSCLLWVNSQAALYIVTLGFIIPTAAYSLGQGAAGMTLFPKIKMGQFSSALGIVGGIGMILGNALAGVFIDLVGNYRMIYAWYVVFELLAVFCAIMVYRYWKHHGGPNHYHPPMNIQTKKAGKTLDS